MAVNLDELRSLPTAEKLRLVELLWDELGKAEEAIPLPDWIDREAVRRREEMRNDPELGLSHDETWKRIRRTDG